MSPRPVAPSVSKLGRATSNTFRAFFALAVVIAAGGTYLAVTDTGQAAEEQPSLLWLLLANLLLIFGVAGALGFRVWGLIRENRKTNGGARLRLRILFLFSLAAAIPTVLVAGFLAVAINRSVESWFGKPVYNLVENASAAARAVFDDVVEDVRSKAAVMASDLNSPNYVEAFKTDREVFKRLFETQVAIRELALAAILDEQGAQVMAAAAPDAPAFKRPSDASWKTAREGLTAMSIDPDETRALIKLRGFDDAYLYVAQPIPPVVSSRLTQAQSDLNGFRLAEARRDQLALVLTLCYAEAAMLMLLGTAWLGMAAAAGIAAPIGQLAGAARSVRDGDLSVRMERPRVRDEIDDLADAFNQMTERIARQTRAIDRARIDAESRSAFIEAVLAGVEAGVIRVDGDLRIMIANASAKSLLGFGEDDAEEDPNLNSVAPEIVPSTMRALESGQPVDLSIRRTGGEAVTHLHVRVAPEIDGAGAVITFHNTTRLIMGQRQAAWRDVARRIAHEIRNPLTPIQLSAERLRRRFSTQITTDRETFDRCTDTITRQVADIGRMVEEFSGFARMPKPTFGDFGLVDMVQSVAFAQRMATPSISIQVNIDSSIEEPSQLAMHGDERMLAQALTNVLKNAAEAVERHIESGSIKSGHIIVDVARDDQEIEISVRDNGPGFPTANRDRVLEPYVTSRKNGVGLGLAIVVRIIEDHGGRLWLGDSDLEPGGAKVSFRMPLRPELIEDHVEYAEEGVA